ncbi:homoserine dehydrogenase [Pontibacter sp. BT310]|uniref:Homoserine dehydrogenase n=1 Tax=Pontibacter populi TaxID=890055 RepID=A0ABS6XD62_9BACT|nr:MULTISPECIES: homoserine dehydrogenase [Pontibacter]MBJ6118594.1 homoserine dehydrogenase [Pontibacter sp. BT310]MBR0571023.1 homoserine dehydrogenase [Microvirga sp. STS03]MBW3365448.1 homoserine dehydrogenase [Pontibacter populi]
MSNKQSNSRIGIFGFGCVGQGLYDVLQTIEKAGIEVAGICVKDKEKPRSLPASAFTYNPQDLLQDESITIFAELISDADEAYSIVKQALKAGKTIVSANKKMLASHLPELIELQQNYNGTLLYEAAVGGSIPIIRTLESYYSSEPLQQVSGILNGSSNFILSKMESEGLSYSLALQQAQELGFAEADPTLDVGGFDSVNKLCLITAHAFGLTIKPEQVLRFGIDTIKKEDLEFAKSMNARIRLVASAEVTEDNELSLRVLPTLVTEQQELYYVTNETNGVTIAPVFAGEQFIKGLGAGSHPTGSAVWADVSAALSGYRYSYPKAAIKTIALNQDNKINIYLRCVAGSTLPEVNWENLVKVQETREAAYFTAIISVHKLQKIQSYLAGKQIFIAEITAEQATNFALKFSEKEEVVYS